MGEGPIWGTANTASSALLFPTRNVGMEWSNSWKSSALFDAVCRESLIVLIPREALKYGGLYLSVLVVIYSYKIGLVWTIQDYYLYCPDCG